MQIGIIGTKNSLTKKQKQQIKWFLFLTKGEDKIEAIRCLDLPRTKFWWISRMEKDFPDIDLIFYNPGNLTKLIDDSDVLILPLDTLTVEQSSVYNYYGYAKKQRKYCVIL